MPGIISRILPCWGNRSAKHLVSAIVPPPHTVEAGIIYGCQRSITLLCDVAVPPNQCSPTVVLL